MFGLSPISFVAGALIGALVSPVTKFLQKQFAALKAKFAKKVVANTVAAIVATKEAPPNK